MNRFMEKAKRGDAETGERAAEMGEALVFPSAILGIDHGLYGLNG